MSTISASTTSTTAYKVTADTTGTLVFQTGATPTTAMTLGSDQSVTFAGAVSLSGNQTTTGNLTVNGNTTLGDASTDTVLMTGAPSIGGAGLGMGMGFRNRIINGAMVIDQRNAGASVTITTASVSQYVLDRWYLRGESATGSKVSVQRSTVAPTGFVNSELITSLSAYTLGATEHYATTQGIEGFNTADLMWGTADAQAVTITFRVRSSVTGTFGGFVANAAINRCYVFSYTISAANTWETKTITIPGDTSGSWLTDNSAGIFLSFSVGAGSSTTGAAGSWGSTFYRSVTGQVSLLATNGATFYITGVQLEKGSTATAFDYRPYGTELALCQRYYYQLPKHSSTYNVPICTSYQRTSSIAVGAMLFPVTMRSSPSIYVNSGSQYFHVSAAGADFDVSTIAVEGGAYIYPNGVSLSATFASGTSTAGTAGEIYVNSDSAILGFTAEL